MKDNKLHPHDKLIGEWLKDTSQGVQFNIGSKSSGLSIWEGSSIDNLVSDTEGSCEFRIKPREFIKGHWYPCAYKGREFFCKFDGVEMQEPVNPNSTIHEVSWAVPSTCGVEIGKSLGEIKFGSDE